MMTWCEHGESVPQLDILGYGVIMVSQSLMADILEYDVSMFSQFLKPDILGYGVNMMNLSLGQTY